MGSSREWAWGRRGLNAAAFLMMGFGFSLGGCAGAPDDSETIREQAESAIDALPGETPVRVFKGGRRHYVIAPAEGERLQFVADAVGLNIPKFQLRVTERVTRGRPMPTTHTYDRARAIVDFYRLRGQPSRTYDVELDAANGKVDVSTKRTKQVDELGRSMSADENMCETPETGMNWCWSYAPNGLHVVPGVCNGERDREGFGEDLHVHFPAPLRVGTCMYDRSLSLYPGRPTPPPWP